MLVNVNYRCPFCNYLSELERVQDYFYHWLFHWLLLGLVKSIIIEDFEKIMISTHKYKIDRKSVV